MADAEVVEARYSTPKDTTYGVLKDRLDAAEQDTIALQADITTAIYFAVITDEQFGAKPTNTAAQNDASIQAAINHVQDNGGGAVIIPPGEFLYNEVTITKPWVTIDGQGVLKGGRIVVGDPALPKDLHFKIKNITLKYDAITDSKNGIELQNARIGIIKNVVFSNCDKAVYIRPIDSEYFQHCNKVSITEDNDFKNVNYCLYVDRSAAPTQAYQIGDFTFSHNRAYGDVHKFHIYGLGVDGLSCKGNFMFFPGNTVQNATKENNIYIERGNWIHIEGNHLFEAGKEAVLLSRCRNFQISNNPIAWPGQREPSDGIRIINGDTGGAITNNGVIAGNSIDYPSRHGISVEGTSGYINIIGNAIRDAGNINESGYYGTIDLTTISHYGVNVDIDCQFVNVIGNMMPDNTMSMLGNNKYMHANIESGFIVKTLNQVLTLALTETIVAVGKYDQINVNQSAATTINSFTGGYEGKEITIIAFNGNTAIAHNNSGVDTFRLKGAVNATIPLNGTIRFRFSQSKWYEISRSF